MFFPTSLISLAMALLPLAAAQYGSEYGSGPAPAVHDVSVGKDGLTFSPQEIVANVGDQVVFHFWPKNHSVIQSSFADPCGRKEGGFATPFFPVPANTTDNFPTHTITVTETVPLWYYCSQGGKTPNSHCGAGMVFSINCGDKSFEDFQKSALAIGEKLKAEAAAAPAESSTPTYEESKPTKIWTAAYGGVTVPAVEDDKEVTATVTVTETVTESGVPHAVTSSWVTVYSSHPGSAAPTPVALAGKEHKVIVGGPGKLLFDPSHIDAAPRDTIVFEFRQKNHTVTQSTFADPCRRKNENGVLGFASGFQPVAADATEFPTWTLKINDTAPIYTYCAQATHCGAGMVFTVNTVESSERNFAAFAQLAQTINGTAAAANSDPAPSAGTDASAPASGAGRLVATGAGLVSVLAIFSSLL